MNNCYVFWLLSVPILIFGEFMLDCCSLVFLCWLCFLLQKRGRTLFRICVNYMIVKRNRSCILRVQSVLCFLSLTFFGVLLGGAWIMDDVCSDASKRVIHSLSEWRSSDLWRSSLLGTRTVEPHWELRGASCKLFKALRQIFQLVLVFQLGVEIGLFWSDFGDWFLFQVRFVSVEVLFWVFSMAETGVPLLKKVYYDNCPGCKQDQINEVNRGIPIKEFLFIWIVTLCTSKSLASFLRLFC